MSDEIKTTEEVKTSPLNDLFDEETIKNLDIYKHQAQLNDMNSLLNNVTNTMNAPLVSANEENVEEMEDYLDTLIEQYTVEDLKKLTPEEVDRIYTLDTEHDGLSFDHIDISTPEGKNDFEFKRDFLVFRKETYATTKSLNDSITELNAYMDEYRAEMDKLNEEYGSMDSYVAAMLDKKVDETTDDPEKARIFTSIRNAYHSAFNLDILTEYVESYKGKNILKDFVLEPDARKVYNRYIKIIKKLNMEGQDLTRFGNFETYVYDDNEIKEKHIRINIFVFALIHFIASKKYDDLDKFFGIFVSQVAVNIKNVVYNNFPEGDTNKFTFMEAARHIVEIIG